MMENLDDFIDQNVRGPIILQYYLVFIPEIIRLMLPVAVLLAALFTVGKMSNLNELTAMKSSGMSIYRFILPFLFIGLMIALLSIYFGGYIVPYANKTKVYIEQNYMKKGIVYAGNKIFFQDSKNVLVTIYYFDVRTDQANRVSIQEFNPEDLTRMISRIDASRMQYDSATSSWNLYNGIKRIFENENESAESFTNMKLDNLSFKPDEVIKKQRKPEEMTSE